MSMASPSVADIRMTSHRPLLLVAVAVAVGIAVDRYAISPRNDGLYGWWAAAAGFLLAFVALKRSCSYRGSACALLLGFVCVSGAWHHLRWNYYTDDNLGRFASETAEPVCVEAVATGPMRWSPAPPPNPLRAIPAEARSETFVRLTRIRNGTQWQTASGDCRLRIAGDLPNVQAGDRLLVFARLGKPSPALNPGQSDWSLAERGASRHSELFCSAPECVSVLEPASLGSFRRSLDRAGRWCQQQLDRYVGPEQSDLALAMALGARERLSPDTFDAFIQTGSIHLLVVSGLHVGLVAMLVWWVACGGFLSRRKCVLVTALLVVAYAFITGGRPPVVRATVLVLSVLTAMILGRRASAANILATAALVILAYNPSELFRAGTQLSFLCAAILVSYSSYVYRARPLDPLRRLILDAAPWYEKTVRWMATRFWHLTVATSVVWIVAFPLVAYHFHIATPIAMLVGPFLWLLTAIALGSALGIWALGWLLPPVAVLLGTVSQHSLSTVRAIVEAAQQIEWGHFYCPGPALWWVLGFYGGLGVFIVLPKLRPNWKWLASIASLWITAGLVTAASRTHEDQLHCTFLAMGHGTCVVLELPGDQTLLYDAGSLGSPRGASRTVASYLWSRGITRIDAIVLSHADVDHYNAVPGLLERFDVGVVYVSPLMFDPWATDGQLEAPNYLRQTIEEAGIPLREIWMNDRLRAAHPEILMEVFHPPRQGVWGRDNANSILLSVQFGGRRILLPGDLESTGMEAVLAERPHDCDILLAPHHGSSNSDPPGFAAWCTPEWVVISSKHERQMTAASYHEVGSQVLQTSQFGSVQFVLGKGEIKMTTMRPAKQR